MRNLESQDSVVIILCFVLRPGKIACSFSFTIKAPPTYNYITNNSCVLTCEMYNVHYLLMSMILFSITLY